MKYNINDKVFLLDAYDVKVIGTIVNVTGNKYTITYTSSQNKNIVTQLEEVFILGLANI